MDITPTKIGYRSSSTPINRLHDSGYVGSESKSVAKKLFHALSPIKEDPLRTKKICNDPDSGIFTSPSSIKGLLASIRKLRKLKHDSDSPDVVRELKFNESLDSANVSLNNDETEPESKGNVVTRFPLNSLKCLQINRFFENVCKQSNVNAREKRQLVRKKVDILSELKSINCQLIVSNVLSHLAAQDLCHVYGVSKTWQELLLTDKKASARRKEYLKNKKADLENQHKSRSSGTNDRYDRSTVLQKIVLCDVTNVTPVRKQDYNKQSSSRFDSFVREGKNLQGGSLMKCPKCSFAAKKQEGNEYMCTECEHSFCKLCLFPFEKFHDCEKLQVPTVIIGSKKSKRNLRRL